MECEHCKCIQLAKKSKSGYFECEKCGLCYPIQRNIIWKPIRTPALGWNLLTVLEALCDSAKTLLSFNNIEKSQFRLNKMLKILRNNIATAKRKNHSLVPRCDYRETNRTRCNKTPVELIHGQYRCKNHI